MTATTVNLIAQTTLTTLLSTELNSLAKNTYTSLSGSSFNNIFTGGTINFNGYIVADVMLNLAAYTGTPTAGSYFGVWFIPAIDGSVYDNSGSTISVGPDVIIPIDALASGPYQRTVRTKNMPVGVFKVLGYYSDSGTGITFAATSNTLKIRPVSYQSQ